MGVGLSILCGGRGRRNTGKQQSKYQWSQQIDLPFVTYAINAKLNSAGVRRTRLFALSPVLRCFRQPLLFSEAHTLFPVPSTAKNLLHADHDMQATTVRGFVCLARSHSGLAPRLEQPRREILQVAAPRLPLVRSAGRFVKGVLDLPLVQGRV
jgi:hypothetical protein